MCCKNIAIEAIIKRRKPLGFLFALFSSIIALSSTEKIPKSQYRLLIING